jgi:RNA polymerase sigma-70 factor (ECF subfamily)
VALPNVKNLFIDFYRRSVLEGQYAQNMQPQFFESSGLQNVENELFLHAVSPQDRTIFLLRYYEGYTAKEISEMLHLPAGTVRSRLHRCRKHLK